MVCSKNRFYGSCQTFQHKTLKTLIVLNISSKEINIWSGAIYNKLYLHKRHEDEAYIVSRITHFPFYEEIVLCNI